MKREEILNIPAGKEMDKLIAELVLHLPTTHLPVVYEEGYTEDGSDGWSGFVCPRCKRSDDILHEPCTKHYSTSIANAWEVVEQLQNQYPDYDFYLEKSGKVNSFWFRINDTSQGEWNRDGIWDKRVGDADAETAPLAICRAALLCVSQ